MSTTQRPFTAASNKFAYAQVFSTAPSVRNHPVRGLFTRLADRRERTRVGASA